MRQTESQTQAEADRAVRQKGKRKKEEREAEADRAVRQLKKRQAEQLGKERRTDTGRGRQSSEANKERDKNGARRE